MGGTFDSMHLGHKVFISVGAMASKKLLIGVTSQFMLEKKKYFYLLESHHKRKYNVYNFIELFDKDLRVEVYDLVDGLGPYKRGKFLRILNLF